MILLSARQLSRQFDADPLFREVTFDLRPGDRVGLVGPNGAGKTTLMHILAGTEPPDIGEVETPNAVRVGLLQQRAEFPPNRTLIEEARAGLAHLYDLAARSDRIAAEMAEATGADLDRLHHEFDTVQEQIRREDAYNPDYRIDEVLQGLGFAPDEYQRPLTSFSGGQKSRVLLARLLLQAPEVLLLDEPTNHLDIATIEWLEKYLSGRTEQALVIVSHDRFFLDRVTTGILELGSGRLTEYPGNFSAYWSQREDRRKVLLKTQEKQQEFIARTEDFIRKNKYGQKHAQAADREKKLARIEQVDVIEDFVPPPMRFAEATRTGDLVLEGKGLTHGFDEENLFSKLNVRVNRGERIGFLGPNGCGKTTLLRCLLGEIEPKAGTVRLGTHVRIGYYDQQLTSVDPSESAVEAIRPLDRPEMTPGTLRSILARFGVTGDLALQRVSAMSGGERSKVALARLAAVEANVLVLDEPTNHLDLWACESLEQSLRDFEGTILFVSHDRYFLDRVANRVFVADNGTWIDHEGNYSEYLAFRDAVGTESPPASKPSGGSRNGSPSQPGSSQPSRQHQPGQGTAKEKKRRRFPYRRVADLEAEIAEKEELLERLEGDLADPDVHRDSDRLKDTTEAYDETQQELATLYEHWEEAVEFN